MQISSLKGAFPFRLGTSSYIIPDDILPNIEFLRDKVDDMELVLFESDEMSNIPDPTVVSRLKEIADESDLTYTVHLPLDTHLGAEDESERRRSVEKHLRVIERMAPVEPFAWVVHFEGRHRDPVPAEDIDGWLEQLRTSAEELVRAADADQFAVEFIGYPLELIAPIVDELGMRYTFDVGHMLLAGVPWREQLDAHLPKTRVFHVHGVVGERDHKSLAEIPEAELRDFIARVSTDGVERVFTMEIFGLEDFTPSMAVMERMR